MAASRWHLAAGHWLLATGHRVKNFRMNRGFGNLGAYNRKLAATDQGQETSSQQPAARGQWPVTSNQLFLLT